MISVVLATHNESKNIKRCLDAVVSFADEIIVVDGQSTDDTVALAKAAGAKVISTTNKANFHINKQMAMDAAKGTLILQLDADEVVTGELAAFIQNTHRNLKSSTEKAWFINRKNYFLGRFLTKGGQYPDPVIRLYIQGYARLPQKDVHEQMIVDGPVGTAQGELLHYSNPTFEDYVRKFNTYTSFKAQQLADEGIVINFKNGFWYCFIKPIATFISLYGRHKGFPGFVFAAMSGLYYTVSFLKLWEQLLPKDQR
jgi:glycosyltransferase involved in cell wall biosynthesis